jgi:tetratricopeptide (TPR) repeat protein
MSLKPLCFVIMPFGQKPDPSGGSDIDFNRVYSAALAPAIESAGMEPIRADEERTGGIIHKPMFERLLLCDYALADLTTANANVFYELGVRHTARPATTLTIFAKHQPIPFDVNLLRSLPYDLGKNNAFGDEQATALREAVGARLKDLRKLAVDQEAVDSPLFDLLKEWQPGDLARLKTDVFRDQVKLNEQLKSRLAAIREKGKDKAKQAEARNELQAFRQELGLLDGAEAGTVIDLMLSFRALNDWDGMIAMYEAMPEVLKRQILVREQLGFAYNRQGDRANALRVLSEVETQQGPSSETCGLIGRVHKDNWSDALKANDSIAAIGHLKLAIEAYTRGFMADQRDAYPGINAVTLLEIKGDAESLKLKKRLVPVVRFAVEQRLAGTKPDYWDHATMLELAVLNEEPERAIGHLSDAVICIRETWEPGTTANNLRMIERSRSKRGADTTWLLEIIKNLEAKAG